MTNLVGPVQHDHVAVCCGDYHIRENPVLRLVEMTQTLGLRGRDLV